MVAHVAECPECEQLFRDGAVVGARLASAVLDTPQASDGDPSRLERLLSRERGLRAFLRSRSTRLRWTLCLILPALLIARELPWRVPRVRELGAPRWFLACLLTGLLGWVVLSALRPAPLEPRKAHWRAALAALAWSMPCVLWFAPEARASADDFSGEFAARSLACFTYGSALAAPSFGLLWLLDRHPRVPYRVWALAAGALALVANLILLVHCPISQRAHCAAGHFSIGLVWFAAVSLAAGLARLTR